MVTWEMKYRVGGEGWQGRCETGPELKVSGNGLSNFSHLTEWLCYVGDGRDVSVNKRAAGVRDNNTSSSPANIQLC